MLAKTLVVFYVWSPDIFVLFIIITLFQALFILLCQIKHYHTISYVDSIEYINVIAYCKHLIVYISFVLFVGLCLRFTSAFRTLYH